MANVMFRKGLSTALPWNAAAEGTFYLTSDTNRLYVGKEDQTLAELNRYVSVVANVASLPTNPAKDDFVYITAGNILAVCTNPNATEVADKWTQINPDTDSDTDTYLKSASAEVKATEDEGITVTLTLKENHKNVKTGAVAEVSTPITTSFTISKDDLLLANNVNVGMGVGTVAGGATVQLEGDGIDSTNFDVSLIAGENVTITPDAENDKITIAAKDTKYTLSTADNKLTLSDGAAKNNIAVETDNDALTATAASDKINYTHKAYTTTPTANDGTDSTPSHGGKFTVVDSITADKGHVTEYNVKTITLPADQNYTYSVTGVELDSEDKSKLKVSLTGANGGSNSSKTSESIFYYTVNGVKVNNQGSIDFYTKDEIDSKIYDVNAMTYKGTVGSVEDSATVNQLPTAGVKVGDTYKVATAGNYGIHSCDIGDLLIATGTETNGIISDNLTWTYVPSGDDVDTKYNLSVANNTITLGNSVDSKTESAIFAAGTDLEVNTSDRTITYSHATYDDVTPGTATGNTLANGGKFTVVDSIETNNGHVTGYKTKEVTLPTITPTTSTLKAAENGVIQLDESVGADSSVTIAAGNDIVVTTTTTGSSGKITVAHEEFTTTPAPQNGATLSHGGKFTVVQAITADNGHITGYETKEWTLPADQNATYTLDGAVAAVDGGIKVTDTLTGANGGSTTTSVIGYVSDNLTIATATAGPDEDARISINFEWDTF